MHALSMHQRGRPGKPAPRCACGRFARRFAKGFAESLGAALGRVVEGASEQVGELIEAGRIFRTSPVSMHVIAGAMVGAAPSAASGVVGALGKPLLVFASQAMVAAIATHASARIFARAGCSLSWSSTAREVANAIDGGLGSDETVHSTTTLFNRFGLPRLSRFSYQRLTACALDLVPGFAASRRVLEASASAIAAARIVARAERWAETQVRGRATRIVLQAPGNDNGEVSDVGARVAASPMTRTHAFAWR